ncbi:hypothetical protein [Streptomyces sp. ITFR-16]|uniref:hypothetical protein n=1 Tax=Streptomyces sp. ITFR-16 TaxID=3075198 RepID=UPI00288C4BC5|nr:hypothetical protein [Streptomyces sp. ITFR-16]WNI25103.1 hypothetical protein RLT58_25900 [Streptomyces sp. ITFR-16]
MSDRYEIVLSCFLRGDLPESALAALRWHLGLAADCPEELDEEEHPWPLFPVSSHSRLPGGDVAILREAEMADGLDRPLWELFARNYGVDDNLLMLDALLALVAPHVAVPGYGGHLRHEFGTEPTAFVFRDGGHALVPPGARSEG